MNQDIMFKAQLLQSQAQELEQHLEIVDRELADLSNVHKSLEFLESSKENSSISLVGKGIHVKTSVESKELLVEVGAGVIVKKSIPATKKVIETQIKRLNEARIQMMNKLGIYNKALESFMNEFQSDPSNSEHKH